MLVGGCDQWGSQHWQWVHQVQRSCFSSIELRLGRAVAFVLQRGVGCHLIEKYQARQGENELSLRVELLLKHPTNLDQWDCQNEDWAGILWPLQREMAVERCRWFENGDQREIRQIYSNCWLELSFLSLFEWVWVKLRRESSSLLQYVQLLLP